MVLRANRRAGNTTPSLAPCIRAENSRLFIPIFWANSLLRNALPSRGTLGALAARFHPDLADAPVWACNLRTLIWEVRARSGATSGEGPYPGFCDIGQRFASAVRDQLIRRDFPQGAVFFAYDTGALETFAALSPRGVRCVLNQTDPNRVEVELVRQEEKRWPVGRFSPSSFLRPISIDASRNGNWRSASW